MKITESKLRSIIRQVILETSGMKSPSIDGWMRDKKTLDQLGGIVGRECTYVPGREVSVIQCDFGSGKLDSLISLDGAIVTLYTENISGDEADRLKDWIKTKPVLVGGDGYRADCAGIKVHDGRLMFDL